MNPKDTELAERLDSRLLHFDRNTRQLPGIQLSRRRAVLIEQFIESIHRVEFVQLIATRSISSRRADPTDALFDPVRAAIFQHQQGYGEDAFWLVFLLVHFGKHSKAGWRYAREVYGRVGDDTRWDWPSVSADVPGFRDWLHAWGADLKSTGRPHGFGNHRKRESLGAHSPNGTGAVVASYVDWVATRGSHLELVREALVRGDSDPREAFDILYKSMAQVRRFGRLARFDYLAMVGKMGLAPITPGSAYMQGATGPLSGARLLFGVAARATEIDQWLMELDSELNVGMQVLEDALCNWQKSPDRFRAFRG